MSCATSSIPVIINGDIYKLGIGHAWGRAREECGGKILCLKQIILKYVRVVVSLFSRLLSMGGWTYFRVGKRHYYYGYYFTGISRYELL